MRLPALYTVERDHFPAAKFLPRRQVPRSDDRDHLGMKAAAAHGVPADQPLALNAALGAAGTAAKPLRGAIGGILHSSDDRPTAEGPAGEIRRPRHVGAVGVPTYLITRPTCT